MNTPLLLYIHAHMQTVNWEADTTTPFSCCSSLALEASLRKKFKPPILIYWIIYGSDWEIFLFPPQGCYRLFLFNESSWKACMELPAVQRNSTHLRACLPEGSIWAASCWFLHAEKPPDLSWLLHGDRNTDCAVGTSAGKPGGSWVPAFAHEQLWIASCFSVVPMHSFLFPWF